MYESAEQYIELDYNIHKKGKLLITNELLDQLTYEQFHALRYIYKKEKATSTDLVHLLHVNKSTISTFIRRMENKGLILRDQPKRDRRKIYLSLSEKGRQLYEDGNQKINTLVREVITAFSESEKEQLFFFIEKLDRLFSEKLQAKGIEE